MDELTIEQMQSAFEILDQRQRSIFDALDVLGQQAKAINDQMTFLHKEAEALSFGKIALLTLGEMKRLAERPVAVN